MTAYRGCVNTGHNGERCANWLSQCYWDDDQFIREEQAAKNGIGNHNYCRNPDNLRWGPWCYQEGKDREKIYCSVQDRLDCDTICPLSNFPIKNVCPSAEERKKGKDEEDNEETCSGSDCQFCNKNPIVCGIVGFLGTAVLFATVLFIRKSMKWRKEAKTIKTTLNRTTVTYERGSQPGLGGGPPSMVYLPEYAQSVHAHTLPIEIHARTLPIEDLLSRMDPQPSNQPFCCTKSLPVNAAVQFRPIQNQFLSSAVPTIGFNSYNRIDRSQEFVPRSFDDVFSDEGQNVASRGVEVEPREVFGDVVRTGDGTLFDKYNEQEEMEI
ncbi:hypothetical protein ACHWQZ_G004070 [Mnemiopsis leidyi]